MSLQTIWAKAAPYVKGIAGLALGSGLTLGTTEYISNKPEVVVPISAARQQLIDTGHVDSEKIRDAMNRTLDEEFKKAGFCSDPSVAEKDIAATVRRAKCQVQKSSSQIVIE